MKSPLKNDIRTTLNKFGVTARILVFSGLALVVSQVLLWPLKDLRLEEAVAMVITLIAAILCLFYLYLRHLLVEPIHGVIAVAEKIAAGQMGERIIIERHDEIGTLALSLNRMAESLEHRLTQLSNLCEISRESSSSLGLQDILNLILKKAVEMQHAKSGSIMLFEENTDELIIKAAINIDPEIIETTRTKIGEGIAGWVAKEGKPLLLLNGVTFKGTRDLKDAVSIPIMLHENVIGVLNLNSKGGGSANSSSFNTKDLEFLTTLANHAASVIDNAQLYEQLRRNYFSIIQALAAAIDAKDSYTHGHSARVAAYTIATAKELGISPTELETLEAAAYLHDIGKIGIPESILSKPGGLSDEEFEIIKTHPEISAKILAPVQFNGSVVPMVRHHHERFGGGGYPDNLKGERIPFEARILAIADAFDAMTSSRPYRPGRSIEWAKEEIRRCSGSQFDPAIVETFIRSVDIVLGAETAPEPGVAEQLSGLGKAVELEAKLPTS